MRPVAGGSAFGGGQDDFLRTTSGLTGGGTLRGDDGADVLIGTTRTDATDIFWVQNNRGADNILNFTLGPDRLKITGAEFGIGTQLDSTEFHNSASSLVAIGTARQFIYYQASNALYFDTDGTGAALPFLIATLSGGVGGGNALALTDFMVI